MATPIAILASEYDASKVTYTTPRQLTNGGRSIFINYNGGMFRMQTPVMKTPFGVSVWPAENGGPDKYNVNFSFEGRETNESIQQFFDVMTGLDKKLVKDADVNSMQWFKKKYPSIDVVQALYTPCVRYGKDKMTGEVSERYAPTLKLNLPMKDGKFDFPVYGPNKDEIDLAKLIANGSTKGVRMMAIIQATGINLVGGNNFSVSWKVRQLRVMEMMSGLGDGYAFRHDGAEAEADAVDMKASVSVDRGSVPAMIEDSLDEDPDYLDA
jgi:hypothetical protein